MQPPEPQKEHQWLQKLVGEWSFETECMMGPGQPPSTHAGTETVRSMGGVWFLCEGHGDMPGGGTATTLMTLGYDPAKKRYVGTFIGSMMTNLWLYEGQLDASGRILTLDTEGPSFTEPGKMAKYQDIIEIKSDNHRVLSSQALGEDGKWHRFMTANYRRRK
jgi:Protein of unknown function (DUF1579)